MQNELRVAIVGLDGHGPVFAREVNGPNAKVSGMRVVKAMSHPSVMITAERLAENARQTAALGIELVESGDALAEGVDGILILHDDGAEHLELVRRFAGRGVPLFVDKPLEATAAKARDLAAVCARTSTPFFTASSLRFSVELRSCLENQAAGAVRSAMAYSPYAPKPTMPGWIYYAVHAVEPLSAIMGGGCREVRCFNSDTGPVAIGLWQDGRIGIARATADCYHGYGFTIWREKGTDVRAVDSSRIYPELLAQVKRFVETRQPPVRAEDSVEVIAFLEAANRSMAAGGSPVALEA